MLEDVMDIRFIVTGHGRSGTKWLAHLLDKDPGIAVHHEPLTGYDKHSYAAVRDGRMSARAFASGRRDKMAQIWERHPHKAYAEVNGFLRYCVPAMRDEFNVPIAAIVRDGRLVVRSMLKRGIYKSDNYPPIQSPVDLLTPFERCCWYWADTYKLLMWQDVPIYRLDRLNKDFACLCVLCNCLGIEIRFDDWQKRAGKRINADIGDVPLEWGNWEHSRFAEIAGDVQRRLGYEI